MDPLTRQLARNLERVRAGIAEAARDAGREADSVCLVAITKYSSIPAARALVELGCQDLGESRPQELWRKAEALRDLPVRWHLIGHLQRNKAARTLPLLTRIHSIDGPRLLSALEQQAATAGIELRGMLEVNISGEAEKHGWEPAEIDAALEQAAACRHVAIDGLMGMSHRPTEGSNDAAVAAADFLELRRLRDRLAERHPLPELSMGMSDDFAQAIRAGATFVRVGSALFEGVEG